MLLIMIKTELCMLNYMKFMTRTLLVNYYYCLNTPLVSKLECTFKFKLTNIANYLKCREIWYSFKVDFNFGTWEKYTVESHFGTVGVFDFRNQLTITFAYTRSKILGCNCLLLNVFVSEYNFEDS